MKPRTSRPRTTDIPLPRAERVLYLLYLETLYPTPNRRMIETTTRTLLLMMTSTTTIRRFRAKLASPPPTIVLSMAGTADVEHASEVDVYAVRPQTRNAYALRTHADRATGRGKASPATTIRTTLTRLATTVLGITTSYAANPEGDGPELDSRSQNDATPVKL